MLISEIYHSRQGEGLLTGTPSVFLRTSGCNLRCSFCDTPFASWNPEGEQFDIERIVNQVDELASQNSAKHVVITGGEPMIQKDMVKLTQAVKSLGMHITMETAGTIYQPVKTDLMSISPKLSNSTPSHERAGEWLKKHEATRHNEEALKQLVSNFEYQLKFVVDIETDLIELEEYLHALNERIGPVENQRVLLMPQGIKQTELDEKAKWLDPYCKDQGFRFSPRMHIQWYGNKRGT